MAVLTVQNRPDRTGVDVTANAVAAAAGGDKFTNDGETFLYVKNGDASSHTLSFTIQSAVDGVVPAAKTVVVAAGKVFLIGPFSTSVYNDGNAQVNVTYDAVTSVTVMPFKVL